MSVLDLEDVKAYLNIDSAEFNTELTGFIAQAEASLARRVGPLVPAPITDRLSPAWGDPLVVSTLPAISLTSVTPVIGTAVDVTTLDLDGETGIIRLKGTTELYWSEFRSRYIGPYTVVYQAGYATLPADLELGAMELVRHLWETQRRMVVTRNGERQQPGQAFVFPYRVLQLIEPYVQVAI